MIPSEKTVRFKLPFLGLAALVSGLLPLKAEPTNVHKETLQPFLEKHCIVCHGAKKQKGDTRFDTIEWQITDNKTAQSWQDILDVLNAGDMPPEDEPQLSDAEFSQITGLLTANLTLARKNLVATGGVNPIRRLNKREYIQSIKQLFGLNIHESLIPDDIRSKHFDTAGGEQYFDGALLEQYVRIGTEIAKEGFKWSGQPYRKPSTKRFEAERTYKEGVDYDMSLPKSESGFYLWRGNRINRSLSVPLGNDPRASYKLRLRGGVHDNDFPLRHFLYFYNASSVIGQRTPTLGVLKVTGTVDNPATTETLVRLDTLSTNSRPILSLTEVLAPEITNPTRWFPIYLNMMGADKKKPNVWVDWTEVEGPFYESNSNIFGDLIRPDGENLTSKDTARELLEKFTFQAFRRVEPDTRYINRLVNYFGTRMQEGLSYEDAMGETLGLVLASPGFLYIEEPQKDDSKILDGRGFANRLSYFLWSAPPDEELYDLAESGELLKPEELRKQVTRMLNAPKADSFYDGFMSQWIELERFDGITVDWKNHLTFNSGVRYSAAREPIEFFKLLVQENLKVDNLISSSFAVVDPQLALYYGLPGENNFEGFKKVALPRDSKRGGVITQSAFLTMGSNGVRTSPVIRGTLILEKFLNNPPPSPPPNVPEIESASSKPVSNRELVELHREQRVCASCHDKIDPIGFGLENFDTVGLWRTKELVGDRKVPVETSGTLVSGTRFDGYKDLERLLKTQDHKLARNLVESLTSYAIGRPIEFSDTENIDDTMKLVKARDFAMQDMIYLITNSPTFRSK